MSRMQGVNPNIVDAETGAPVIDRVRRWKADVEEELANLAIPSPYALRRESGEFALQGLWIEESGELKLKNYIAYEPLYVTAILRSEDGFYWAELTWKSRWREPNGDWTAISRIVPLQLVKSGRALAAYLRKTGAYLLPPGAGGARIERYLAAFIETNEKVGALVTRPVEPAPPIPDITAPAMWKAIDQAVKQHAGWRSGTTASLGREFNVPIPGAADGDCLYLRVTLKRHWVKVTIDRINARRGPADEQEDWYREHLDPAVRMALAALPDGVRQRDIGWLPRGGDVYLVAEPIARAHVAGLLASWLEREIAWSRGSDAPDGIA